jgi:hypothetical protein
MSKRVRDSNINDKSSKKKLNTYTNTVNLENTYSYKNFNNLYKDKLTENFLNFTYLFILRKLFFYDQIHDFCDKKGQRNNWNDINKVYNNILKLFIWDIQWLMQEFNITPDDIEKNKKFYYENLNIDDDSDVNIFDYDDVFKPALVNNVKDYARDLLLKILDIININIYEYFNKINEITHIKIGCTDSFNKLLDIYNKIDYSRITKKNIIFAVDADQSSYDIKNFVDLVCDIIDGVDNRKINNVEIYNSISGEYDSASGSALATKIKYYEDKQNNVNKILKNIDESKIPSIINKRDIEISLNGKLIIKYKYTRIDDDEHTEDYYILNRLLTEKNYIVPRKFTILKIKEILTMFNITYLDSFQRQQLINLLKTAKDTINEKLNKLVKDRDEGTKIYQFCYDKKKFIQLDIYQFYKLTTDFNNYNGHINSSNSSVSKLTERYSNINKDINCIFYKTIGDFGQIIDFYNYTKNNLTSYNFFITFDKMCSYISSLFNINTIEEVHKITEFPLNIFITSETKKAIDRQYMPWFNYIKNLFINEYTTYDPTSFGKYKNSKQSIKTYGIPKKELSKSKINSLINLAKKYNIKLNDDTYKNLKRLYKLQLLAKKYKIPITYTKQVKINKKNVSKRFYKSISMLEKNLF